MLTLRKIFTYAGVIPFILPALFLVAGKSEIYPPELWVNVIITYGAVILSFLAGIYWGLTLSPIGHATKITRFFAFFSVVLSLTAWVCLLNRDNALSLTILMIGFLTCLWLDEYLRRSGLIDRDYFRMRLTATIFAMLGFTAALLQTINGYVCNCFG